MGAVGQRPGTRAGGQIQKMRHHAELGRRAFQTEGAVPAESLRCDDHGECVQKPVWLELREGGGRVREAGGWWGPRPRISFGRGGVRWKASVSFGSVGTIHPDFYLISSCNSVLAVVWKVRWRNRAGPMKELSQAGCAGALGQRAGKRTYQRSVGKARRTGLAGGRDVDIVRDKFRLTLDFWLDHLGK